MSPNMFSVRRTSNCAGLRTSLHRGVVDVHHGEGDVRRGGLEAFGDDLAPEDGGLEDVGLVDQGDVLAAGARGGDGDVGDAFDLRLAVDHGIDRFDVAAVDLLGGLRSEVEAAGELADADHVDAVGDAVRADGRGVDEVLQQQAGADVGVEREVLAEGQEGGALRLFGRGSFSHFGPPTEPKRMASAARQASRVESGRALPWLSMPAPPTSWVECSRVWPDFFRTASRTGRAAAMTSGPM
jgi:hypothetical protein